MWRCRLIALSIVALALVPAASRAEPGDEFFEKKIRPILVEHCYSCHSVEAKKHKGDLLLDSKAALLKGGETGPGLVPGKANESLLIKAIRYDDSELRMPPKGKLPETAIADLTKWVAMGAPDTRTGTAIKAANKYPTVEEGKNFWAFKQPVMKPAPEVKLAAWPKGDIDRFLLAEMEKKNLQPGPDADRTTLARRAYFALIGLPPTPDEVDTFVKDTSPDAYAKLVDRLLDSPHFGERWGRHWLDVARYADSSGGGRSLLFKDAWRYRDYVIQSVNADTPFNRFIVEQIAGDLLEGKTPEERRRLIIATAFLILGPTNYERQDKPLLEMDVIDEQIDTIGKAFLGMTIGCARCHDHKFDPIPTKDYYALAGIFKSSKFIIHNNVSRWNETPLPGLGDEDKIYAKHDAAIAAVKTEIEKAKAKEPKTDGTVLVKGVLDPKKLPGIVIDDKDAKKIGNWKHSVFTGNFIGEGYLHDDRSQKSEKTLTFQPEFAKSGTYEVRFAYSSNDNRAANVPVRVFHADGDDTIAVNEKKIPPIDGRFVSLGKFKFVKGNQWFVMVSTEGSNGHVTADAVQFLLDDEPSQADAPSAKTPPATEAPLAKSTTTRSLKDLEAELKKLTTSGPERPTAMSISEGNKVEDCHICIRGNFHNKGATAPRGFLQVVPAATTKINPKESGRKQLAEWLVSPENPLTPRITVNRIWHHLFGVGLVRTVDNFGVTGELPSHPELLDYLAVRFVENGWSTKKMVREIMLTHAYQLSSAPHPQADKIDPENRLLARHSRRRLDAESLRDSILVASGQLDLARFGPTMGKTPPAEKEFKFTDTRRSVYTPVLRNKLLEIFDTFDFADPNVSTARRNISTVSTQALYFMNSPFIQDQAKIAAGNLNTKAGLDDTGRLDVAYRSLLGRWPTDRERHLSLEFLKQANPAERNQAWERVFHTLFACVDFRYVN